VDLGALGLAFPEIRGGRKWLGAMTTLQSLASGPSVGALAGRESFGSQGRPRRRDRGMSNSRGRQVMAELYVDSISLTRTLPCLAEPGKIIVVGKPSRALDDVLPYLANLPNVIAYNPQAQALTLRRQPGLITLGRERVSITQVTDTDEGLELLATLAEAINATWQHRHELMAATAPRRAPRPLDIWALLPQSNCRECGEATCMAFAFGLVQGKRKGSECPPLRTEPAFADRRAALEAIF